MNELLSDVSLALTGIRKSTSDFTRQQLRASVRECRECDPRGDPDVQLW